jgi:hypothetical protein
MANCLAIETVAVSEPPMPVVSMEDGDQRSQARPVQMTMRSFLKGAVDAGAGVEVESAA